MKANIRDFAESRGGDSAPLELDALIVGAGFSGVYCLHEIRKLGLKAAIFEAASGFGGVWRWNCYPGAGVDSETTEYQYSIPETWKDWTWSTNYPRYPELRAYFDHVSKTLDIEKDCVFGAAVVHADFNQESGRWTITTQDGRQATAKYFIVGSGFAAKRHVPDWPGIETYRGAIHHSSLWPESGVDVTGKRCAVIGTGATGVQLTQALGSHASDLTVFQRTPNLALPMHRRPLSVEEQERLKPVYPELFRLRETSFGGFLYTPHEKSLPEDSKEDIETFLEGLWEGGGFRFWVSNYKDLFKNAESNRVVYDFWARKVRPRIQDEKLRDVLAPLDPPHAFGIKRPSLEVDYYDQFNKPNVHLVDIHQNPISRLTETGIQLEDGTQHDVDVICVATGFDVSSGGLMDMGLRSIHGTPLKEEWKDCVTSYLGVSISGYPNLFFTYGPHGPTALSNGPSTIEVQGRWIVDAIRLMERRGIKSVNATQEAAQRWKDTINDQSNGTLFPTVKSTYMGGTFPGKPFEQLNWTAGLPAYANEIRTVLPEFKGFEVEML
ncbi:hypothetical protein BJX99DRAFT_257458 [Aspergillus californicus]